MNKIVIYYAIFVVTFADWVEIPQMKPEMKNVLSTGSFKKISTIRPTAKTNSITLKPNKSSVKEVFGTYGRLTTQIYEEYLLPITSTTSTTTTQPSIQRDKLDKESKESKNESGYDLFMSLLKTVQSNLMKNTHKNIKSKLNVLNNLKDTLLMNIDHRMKQLWPVYDDDDTKRTREYPEESHIDFPSNEGALITIGFLTLAVFLVKLVLQVIQVIKAKKLYYNGTATTGRRKRSTDYEIDNTYKILHLIESYQFTP